MSNRWRAVAAALADPYRRRVYAELVVGLPGSVGRRREKAIADLRAAGLVDDVGAPTERFAELLAESAPERLEGVDRWVRDGRIDQYPAKPSDRLELLEWAAARLPTGELDERAVTEALAQLAPDGVTLRRYLVDAGLLVRAADGSRYSRP